MGSQDWAQITFKLEIHSNGYINESGKWSAKLKNPRSGDLGLISKVFHGISYHC